MYMEINCVLECERCFSELRDLPHTFRGGRFSPSLSNQTSGDLSRRRRLVSEIKLKVKATFDCNNSFSPWFAQPPSLEHVTDICTIQGQGITRKLWNAIEKLSTCFVCVL